MVTSQRHTCLPTKRYSTCFSCLVTILYALSFTPAQAYTLSTRFAKQTFIEKRTFPSTYALKGLLQITTSGKEETFEETFQLNTPNNSYTYEIRTPLSRQLLKRVQNPLSQLADIGTLLWHIQPEAIRSAFLNLQFTPNLETPVGLTHRQDQVLWVINASKGICLWLGQHTFLPSALLHVPSPLMPSNTPGNPPGSLIDIFIQQKNFQEPPQEISLFKQDVLFLKATWKMQPLTRLKQETPLNSPLPDALKEYCALLR